MNTCDVYWGSHGCDLPAGDDHEHRCEGCCDDPENGKGHFAGHQTAPDGYGFDGCAGAWPYYGSESMSGPDAPLPFFSWPRGESRVDLPDEFNRVKALHERQDNEAV